MSNCGTKCGGKPNLKKKPKVIMEDEGDVYVVEEEYPSFQTFKSTVESGETMRGVFYGEDKSSYIFLNRHENIWGDLISTCKHESIHSAIWQIIEWEYIEMWNDELTEKWSIKGNNNLKEHNAIRIMLSPEEYFGE